MGYTIGRGKSLQTKHYILSAGDLLITNIDSNDVRRRYRCQVANRLTGERTDSTIWARIVLIDRGHDSIPGLKNNLSPPMNALVVNEGQSVALYCSFDGQPRPTLEWYYASVSASADTSSTATMKRLSTSDTGSYRVTPNMLLIANAQHRDSGRFICVANTTRAEQRYETQVIVRTSLSAHLSASSSTPSLGEDIILNCNLTVIEPSQSPTASTIPTSSSAYSIIAGVKWFRNMRPIVMDHRIRQISETVINIRSFRYSDAGVIQCFIHLKAGPDYEEWLQSATVLTMEGVEKAPVFTTVFSEQIKMGNSDLGLKCAAVGLPPPQIEWKLDEMDVSGIHRARVHSYAKADRVGTVSQLNISSLRMEETGVFQCIASNSRGTVAHRARINIMGSLYIKPIGNVSALVGHSVTINCSYSGYPIEEVFFLKGNRRLPLDERHSQPSIGRLTISHVDRTDEDVYKCVVLSLSGQRMEQTFHLRVSAAPAISPFMFSDNLEEGMRSSAVCSVISGGECVLLTFNNQEPPITIRWLKDGKPLSQIDADLQIVSINEFISSLIISNISRYHKGNYTCVASSDVSSTNFTAIMAVRAAPQWIVKPADRHAVVGQPALFDCQSTGFPQPVTRWKFIRVSAQMSGTGGGGGGGPVATGSDAVSILSSPQIHVLENGSLSIRAVEVGYQGVYVCDASNGVGRPLEVSAKLFVHSVPQISVAPKQVTVRRASQVQFQCIGAGTAPLTIQWLKNGVPLNSVDRYVVREEFTKTGGTEKSSQIAINNSVRDDTAVFTCLAVNQYGSDNQDVNVAVQEPPDPPTGLRGLEVGARSLSLAWTLNYFGNSVVVKHSIQYKRKSEQWFEALLIHSTSNTVTIVNLSPVTAYDIRVRVENEIGFSDYSEPIAITTTMEGMPI
ncbi:unnamed protein product [Oppiella nova]|uniref:Uncharacterized protein n=1 Tax=Oppiella nova TaxID=334625 RepID=A0A7R9LN59_9ACAR|nr:unnamed protein product [Oppiella nova]CAG2164692.1 unnamed protein product [Oppiella nova]